MIESKLRDEITKALLEDQLADEEVIEEMLTEQEQKMKSSHGMWSLRRAMINWAVEGMRGAVMRWQAEWMVSKNISHTAAQKEMEFKEQAQRRGPASNPFACRSHLGTSLRG